MAPTVHRRPAAARSCDFHAAEERLLERYGVSAHSRWVEVAEVPRRTRVLECGDGDPLLLMPGGGMFAGAWAPLMAELSGFRLLAVDWGFGLSGPVSYRGVDIREHAIAYLESLLDALKLDSVTVLASSMGALWSLWLALERPQRVHRLALAGCPAFLLGTSAPAAMRLLSVRGLGRMMHACERPTPAAARRVLRRIGHRTLAANAPAELPEALAAHMRLPSFPEAWLSLLHACLTPLDARRSLRFGEAQLRRVEQPVHLIWGSNDPFGNVQVAQQAAALLPRGSLDELGEGHAPWLDEPAAVAASVRRFIDRYAQRGDGDPVEARLQKDREA